MIPEHPCWWLNRHDDFFAGSICALLSVIPNVLLLLTFGAARKRDQKLRMGAVHFGILALIDIAYGLGDTISDFPFSQSLG